MKSLASLILCCFMGSATYSQQTVSVQIPIIVDDQDPTSLNLADLKVEIGHKPATITSIMPLAGKHLQYVLLNDAREKNRWPKGIRQQTDAAVQFLKQVLIAGSDVGSLVNFSDQVYIDVQNDKDPQNLAAKLDREGRGGPVMYDAVVSAAKWLAQQSAADDYRRVMFLFGDGKDRASKKNLNQTVEALQASGIPVYIFAPSSVETEPQGEILREIATQSGGRILFLSPDKEQLKFGFLKRDLAQSFLLKIDFPQSGSTEALPLVITDVKSPQTHIISPSQILKPQ